MIDGDSGPWLCVGGLRIPLCTVPSSTSFSLHGFDFVARMIGALAVGTLRVMVRPMGEYLCSPLAHLHQPQCWCFNRNPFA
jgi:hypothetical protein